MSKEQRCRHSAKQKLAILHEHLVERYAVAETCEQLTIVWWPRVRRRTPSLRSSAQCSLCRRSVAA